MPKTLSGKAVIHILCRHFGFFIAHQKGSHVKLRKDVESRVVTTVVPLHRELARGTLKGVLELAEVEEKNFWKNT